MVIGLKLRTFYIAPDSFGSFLSCADRFGKPPYEIFQDVLDQLIEKYNPNDSEKLKLWKPAPLDLRYDSLRNIWLIQDQISTVDAFADKASIALGQDTKKGTVMRTAIMEYFGKRRP